MTLAMIASLLSTIALWGFLFTFGLWAYRKFHFRSLPWVAGFVILSQPLSIFRNIITNFLTDQTLQRTSTNPQLFGHHNLGSLMAEFSYWSVFISNLAYLILAVLILSDIVILLSNSGIDVKDKLGLRLISLRQKSTVFGLAMLVLKIVPTVSIILFFSFGL